MAKEDQVRELKQQSRFAAMEGLSPKKGPPVPPRKAMAHAKKRSKGLSYPLPPYPNANPILLFLWAREEWRRLDRWQSLALPFVIIVGLLTWEKEKSLQADYRFKLDQAATKRYAARIYGALGPTPKRRKLLGFIPLPGRG